MNNPKQLNFNTDVVDPNSYQVGGDHYAAGAETDLQHWDLMWFIYGESYFRANASKYVERFRRKNGKQDLLKAAQYIHKLINVLNQENLSPKTLESTEKNLNFVNRFVSMRERTSLEKAILFDIFFAASINTLQEVYSDIGSLILSEYPEVEDGSEPTQAYVDQARETSITDDQPNLKFFKLSPEVELPSYAKAGDAGMDVRAFLPEVGACLYPGDRRLIPTGLKMSIPSGYMVQVCSRSGLAAKNGVISLISPGIIDSGYRGELQVCLYNSGDAPFDIRNGDRIAQLILQHTPMLPIEEVSSENELGSTDRGAGGFGSTGVNS